MMIIIIIMFVAKSKNHHHHHDRGVHGWLGPYCGHQNCDDAAEDANCYTFRTIRANH